MSDDQHELGRFQMTRGAMYAFMGLSLAMMIVASFNVYLWADSRSAHAELNAERNARLSQRQQDEKAKKIAQVTSCAQSIPLLAIANHLIDDARDDHYSRANQAEALAKADPTADLARIHKAAGRLQRKKARALKDFPSVTQRQCDKLARRLGVEPVKASKLDRSDG